jgi:hypothetical protein
MPSYLVETYLANGRKGELAARERRARSAAEELTSVSFDRSIHVSEDEMCFYVFDAASSEDALLAAEHAELHPIRVVEAVSSSPLKEGT